MVSIDPQGTVLPSTPDLPDRDEARRQGHPKYQDDRYPCKTCGDPAPVRYRATDACVLCLNSRPRGR